MVAVGDLAASTSSTSANGGGRSASAVGRRLLAVDAAGVPAAIRPRSRARRRLGGVPRHHGRRRAAVPFFRQHAGAAEQRRRFYPAMLKAIDAAERSITIEAYIYWAGEIGCRSPRRSPPRPSAACGSRSCSTPSARRASAPRSCKILEEGGCHVAWYNPFRWLTCGRFNNRTHRKSLIIDGRRRLHRRRRHRRSLDRHAQDAEHWRDMQIRIEGPAVRPLQTGFAHNWLECTGELVTGADFLSAADADRAAVAADDHELAGDRRVVGAHDVLPGHLLGAETIDIANPYFVPDHVSIDMFRTPKRGVHVASWCRDPQRHAGHAPQQRASMARCSRPASRSSSINRTMMHHKTMIVDGCGRPSAPPTSTIDRSRTTRRATSACATRVSPRADQTFERDLAVCDASDARPVAPRPPHRTAEALGLVRAGSGLATEGAESSENLAEEDPKNASWILLSNEPSSWTRSRRRACRCRHVLLKSTIN